MEKFKVVDLFAGAGGLSLGFMQTQKYDIKVAFENSEYMQATYRRNHKNVDVRGDVCVADYGQIMDQYGTIDVVIGGPPCQGFSNANRQKNHAISQNNMLVKQYIRAILELKPKAFVMENVSMLKSEVHRFYMERRDLEIVEKCRIDNKNTPLHLIDSEFCFDGALEMVQNLEQIHQHLWPDDSYALLNVIYKNTKNINKMIKALEKHKSKLLQVAAEFKESEPDGHVESESKKAFRAVEDYFSGIIQAEEIKAHIEPAIMIQRMLKMAEEIFDHDIVVDSYSLEDGIDANIRSFAVYDYLKGILESPENGYVIKSGVLCAADFGAPQKRKRFVVIGIHSSISDEAPWPRGSFTEENYRTVKDAIYDLEDVEPVYTLQEDSEGIPLEPKDEAEIGELAYKLRDSKVLKNHIITKTTPAAMERFHALHQGENFHSLDDALKTNTYTDVARTQNTIYLRLKYGEPSGTVVNVRKSMWVHPTKDRAVSIREAARLQTFPDSFVFCGTKDKQYQQVGNAVPPIMAKSIAKKLAAKLNKCLSEGDKGGR